nr:MAG TPA: minor tail protein [Caudoviricetes sp.]
MSDFRAKIIAELDTKKIPSSIKNIEKQKITLRNFTLDTKGLPSEIQASLDKHKFTINLDGIKSKNIDIATGSAKKSANEIQLAYNDLMKMQKRISSIRLNLAGLDSSKNSSQIVALRNQLSSVDTEYKHLLATFQKDLSPIQLDNLQREFQLTSDKIAVVSAKAKDAARNVKNIDTPVSSLQAMTLDNKMSTWLEKNSKASKDFGNSIDLLRNKLSTLNASGKLTTDEFRSIQNEFKLIQQQAIATGKIGRSFGSTFSGAFKSILQYVNVSTIIYQSISGLKQMFQNVVDIDSAMTELKKVTNESSESYSKFLSTAGSSAKEIGTTVTSIIESTANFARLGYSFSDSQELAKTANIYAVVGDEIDSVDTATKSIISTMAAYKDEITDSMQIADKFNEVSNHFAISSGGIGDSLQRSASSLAAANNSLDQSIALITAANTVVQDPETVGTAFKTISMRIRGAKTELEEAGLETDGMVESTAKLRQEIKALSGVDIMLNDTTFKSTYDIMDELAVKWKDLTDIQQGSITELIAGKRQGNVVSSLMSNFDIARDALETSMNSEGSAMAEHAKWMESLEAKINQLQATWQELSQAFMNDGFLKGLVDAGTDILSFLTAIIDKIGALPALITAITSVMSFKNVGRDKMFSLLIVYMPTVMMFPLDIMVLDITLNEIHLVKQIFTISVYIELKLYIGCTQICWELGTP